MFRDIVRVKQKISEEECVEILKAEMRGVLCVLGDEDYPQRGTNNPNPLYFA